jgi:trimeric autotransporter adhesin
LGTNIGIGTISPAAQLHTTGTLRFTGAGTPGTGKVLTSDASGNATWQAPSGGTSLPTGNNGQTLRHSGSSWESDDFLINKGNKIWINFDSTGPTMPALYSHATAFIENNNNAMLGNANDSHIALHLASTTQVTGDGVGLAFSNSEEASLVGAKIVHIRTGGWSVGDLCFFTRTAAGSGDLTTEKMRITSTGNIGIGTSTPARKLEVSGSGEQFIRVSSTGTSDVGIELLRTGASTGDWRIANVSGNLRFFWSDDDYATTTTPISINNINGRVGIGTIAPTQQLDVAGNIRLRDANRSIGTFSSHELALVTNSVERINIKTDGKVGIGTTTPSGLLTVNADGSGTSYPAIRANNTNATGIALYASASSSDAAMVVSQSGAGGIMAKFFDGGSNDVVRIDNGGGANIGAIRLYGSNTSTSYGGFMNGSTGYGLVMGHTYLGSPYAIANAYRPTSSTSAFVPWLNNTTSLGNATYRWIAVHAVNGTIQTSDKNQKENIQDISYGLDAVMKLKPISFRWKDKNCSLGTGNNLGFIAQDLEKVIPDVVVHSITPPEEIENARNEKGIELDPETYGVKYSELVPVLVKAMQEQQVIIENQNIKIEFLQQQIDELKNK